MIFNLIKIFIFSNLQSIKIVLVDKLFSSSQRLTMFEFEAYCLLSCRNNLKNKRKIKNDVYNIIPTKVV